MYNSNNLNRLLRFGMLTALICCVQGAFAATPLDKFWPAAGRNFPAAGEFRKPLPIAAGQYVVTGTTVRGRRDSVSRMLLVGKQDGAWIIEVQNFDKNGVESVNQMAIIGYEEAIASGSATGISISWMKSRQAGGEVQTMEGDAIAMINVMMKSTLEGLVSNIPAFVDGGTITAPAGSFIGTNLQNTDVRVLGFRVQTQNWYHPAVPVNGLVKTQSSDGRTVTELLSFGFDGRPVL